MPLRFMPDEKEIVLVRAEHALNMEHLNLGL